MSTSINATTPSTSPDITPHPPVSTTSTVSKNDTMIPTDNEMKGPFVATSRILQAIEEMKKKQLDDPNSADDAPSVIASDVSSVAGSELSEEDFVNMTPTTTNIEQTARRLPLQWEFKGLTLWIELEHFENDLARAIEYGPNMYGTSRIPIPHVTAIYNMRHLSIEQAKERLDQVPKVLSEWPDLEAPKGVRCDLAIEGLPGQVCSIAWSELTFPSNPRHEAAVDRLHDLFDCPRTHPQWTPHISLAYDNPNDSVLNMQDLIAYVKQNPTLLQPRKVVAMSLWDTEGKIADFKCYHRVSIGSPKKDA